MNDYSAGALEALTWAQQIVVNAKRLGDVLHEIDMAQLAILRDAAKDFSLKMSRKP